MSEYIYGSLGELLTNIHGKIYLSRAEIVRCKDCKFKDEPWNCAAPYYVESYGFCKWGERK